MAHRRMTDTRRRRRRSSVAQRQYFHDALIFLGISVRALGDGRGELARWKGLAAAQDGEPPPAKPGERGARKRTRRRRSARRPKKASDAEGVRQAGPPKQADGEGREAAPPHDG
jgi:poly(A) polymerase